ncbi:hypothetical protein CWS43_12485 [Rahnella sp. AA]|uniref:DUF7024 domain-containing protein n=1 Tax=Rahnella sp. AA TaxID=2057180 RepID=UPI000C34EEA6|nr:glycosyltransferase family 39 protein [Rahnella sp. AA]PKE30429.1 hypothetical protein CWS43_12485 [Rahnella sp. AA]
MKYISSKINTNNFFILIILLSVIFLIAKNMGLYPTVFADEYTYSKYSRLLPLGDSTLPNYLFLSIYSVTDLCGAGFLECARLLNVLFFVLASPFIYLIGRKFTGHKTSCLIAFLSMLSPINTYTAYFMPESLYYLSFWVLTYLILNIEKESSLSHWLFIGFVFGLSALIKPHALLLAPALVVYFLIIHIQDKWQGKETSSYINYLGLLTAIIATKIIIGYILAGKSGITVFGSTYTSMASGAVDSGHYIKLIQVALSNLQGHLLSLLLLFSVPICHLIFISQHFFRHDENQRNEIKISLYTSLVIASLLVVVTLFTASVSGSGPYETISRLHMRYYNFAFPLFILVVASQLNSHVNLTSKKWRAIIGLPILVALLYGFFTKLAPYAPNFIDSPEIRGFVFSTNAFYVLSFISMISLMLWIYSINIGARFFLYLFLPLSILVSTFFVNYDVRGRINPTVYDNAGLFAKQYFKNMGMSDEDIVSKVAIIGQDSAGLFRVLFHIDNSKISMDDSKSTMIATSDVPNYDLSKLPAKKEWALVIGDYPKFEESSTQISMNGFTLVKAVPPIDFSKNTWPGVISKAYGLSSTEGWGTWSVGNVVRFEFSTPLPLKFKLRLTAHAFGPNIGKEFIAIVGGTSEEFKLGENDEEKIIAFDNETRTNSLQIIVPLPSSPKIFTKGLNGDERNLGIGLVQMKIVPMQ